MKANKAFWLSLLLIALLLFLLGLNTGQYLYSIASVVLSFIVYRNGYDVLFREYDEAQKEKRATAEKIYQALREGKKEK